MLLIPDHDCPNLDYFGPNLNVRSPPVVLWVPVLKPNFPVGFLGERALPRGPLPTTFTSLDCLAQAVAYIHAAGDLWTSTPGAVDWALKCRNLFDVMMMLRNSEFSVTLATSWLHAFLVWQTRYSEQVRSALFDHRTVILWSLVSEMSVCAASLERTCGKSLCR